MFRSLGLFCLVVLGPVVSASCSAQDSAHSSVVTSSALWADIISHASCGSVDVSALIPAGADLHEYQPSLADRAELEVADVVVMNGAGLEDRFSDLLDSLGTNDHTREAFAGGSSKVVDLSTYITNELIRSDPHYWMNPNLVARVVEDFLPELAERLGLDLDSRCLQAYIDNLHSLDAQISAELEAIEPEQRTVITYHPSLSYFAKEFGIVVVGSVLESSNSDAQSSAKHVADLIAVAKRGGARALVGDEEHSVGELEEISRAAGGVAVVVLQTDWPVVAGQDTQGFGGYPAMLREAAAELSRELSRAS